MPRIRTVKPDFWADEGVAALSRDARLLFIATWNLADDEGLLRWTPDYVKAQVFPYDSDLTIAKVKKLMAEVTEGDFLFAYTAGRVRQQLAFVVRFLQHQRINRPQPGRLPPPPYTDRRVREMLGRRDGMICGICSEAIEEVTEPWTNVYDNVPGNRYHEQEAQRLSVDHVVARSKGGHDYPSNLQASHISCNKGRGNRDLPESVTDTVTDSLNGAGNDSLAEGNGLGSGSNFEGVGGKASGAKSEKPARNPEALDQIRRDRFKKQASA